MTEAQNTTANDIDYALRDDNFQHVPINGMEYHAWYARLLSTLTLLLEGETINYAQTDYEDGADAVQFSLFTEKALIRVNVTGLHGDAPVAATLLIPRAHIEELGVDASMRIDQPGSMAIAWPGYVQLRVKYRGHPQSFRFAGQGAVSREPEKFGPIVDLLHSLKADLTA